MSSASMAPESDRLASQRRRPRERWAYGLESGVRHLLADSRVEKAREVLSSFEYVFQRLRCGGARSVLPLLDDLRRAVDAGGGSGTGAFAEWDSYLRGVGPLLLRGSPKWETYKILLQTAWEHAEGSPVTAAAESFLAAGECDWIWLRRRCRERLMDRGRNPCLLILSTHQGGVASLSLDASGRRLVSGSFDQTVRVWSLPDGECLSVLSGHTARIWAAAISRDGRMAASASEDGVLRLWHLEPGECRWISQGHSKNIRGLAFSDDARWLVSTAEANLRVWDVDSGVCWKDLRGHEKEVMCVEFCPRTGRLVSAGTDATLRVWDITSGECLKILRSPSSLFTVRLAPDAGQALTCGEDGVIRVWNLETGDCVRELHGHEGMTWALACTPDGTRAVSGDLWGDFSVRLWDVERGECSKVFYGHTLCVNSLVLTPDGNRAISGSGSKWWQVVGEFADTSIRMWDLKADPPAPPPPGNHDSSNWLQCVVMDPVAGKVIASGGTHDSTCIWDLEGGEMARLEFGSDKVAVDPSSSRVASVCEEEILLWDLRTGEEKQRIHCKAEEIVFHPNGLDLLAGVSEGVDVLNLQTGELVQRLKIGRYRKGPIDVSPDGASVCAIYDHLICVWRLASGKRRGVLRDKRGFRSARFFQGNDAILTAAEGGRLTLWSIDTETVLEEIEPDRRDLRALALRLALEPERGTPEEWVEIDRIGLRLRGRREACWCAGSLNRPLWWSGPAVFEKIGPVHVLRRLEVVELRE